MRYIGENCPYCGVTFAEQDDVVVCPECATPHHRVCWFAHGECATTEKHGTHFVWKKCAPPEPEKEPEQQKKTDDSAKLDIVCPDCGTTCENGTVRCPECGAMLIPFTNPTGEPPLAQFRQGFDPNEDIRGIKSGDIALFCRTASASYVKKFRRKRSWSWAAFLCSPFWFFYRKMYKAGAIFLTVYLVLNLLFIPAQLYLYNTFYNSSASVTMNGIYAEIDELIEPYIVEDESSGGFLAVLEERLYGESVTISEEGQKALEKYLDDNREFLWKNIGLPMLRPVLLVCAIYFLGFLLKIVSALLADRLYFKKASAEIKRARSLSNDERVVQLELFRKGGVNIFLGFGLYFVCNMIINAAMMLVS